MKDYDFLEPAQIENLFIGATELSSSEHLFTLRYVLPTPSQ